MINNGYLLIIFLKANDKYVIIHGFNEYSKYRIICFVYGKE
jgi:hypothetical protein